MKRSIFDIRGDRPAKRIQEALYAEMDKRGGNMHPGWQQDSIEALWEAVNEERKKLGKGSIEKSKIIDAQQYAFGHVDYVAKVAFQCEKLVYE